MPKKKYAMNFRKQLCGSSLPHFSGKIELCGGEDLFFGLHLILEEKLSSADMKTFFFALHLFSVEINLGGDFIPHFPKKVEDR